jgi:hypothetical protein
MAGSQRRAVTVLVLMALVVIVLGRALMAAGQEPDTSPEGNLQFAPEMREADRAWVRAAIATARPEAQRLIDEIDGAITVSPQPSGMEAIGMAHVSENSAVVTLDTAALNGERALDRNVVVLHELGHVVDFLLVPDALSAQLDAGIPQGACQSTFDHVGACTAVEERFADTFAKWALGGAVSMAGSGYGIPTPASLEDWGAPLGELAARLTVEARG